MASFRGKRVAVAAAAAGAAVVVALLFPGTRWIKEEIAIRRLRSGDPEAAARLGELRSARGVPELIRAMRTGGVLLEPSARALSAIGKPAVGPLRDLLEDHSCDLLARGYAAQALAEIGPEARGTVGGILRLIHDTGGESQSFERSRRAFETLAVPTPEILASLEALLSDPSMGSNRHVVAAVQRIAGAAPP